MPLLDHASALRRRGPAPAGHAAPLPGTRPSRDLPGTILTGGGASVPQPRQETISVLVVDGHAARRDVVTRELATLGVDTVHQAGSITEARGRAAASGPCDLALVDLTLPDGSGLDLVTELRAQGWNRIVALAGSDDPGAVRASMRAGAQAYLVSAGSGGVPDTVRRFLDPAGDAGTAAAPLVAAGTRVAAVDDTPRELSAREVEVLQLVANGRSNKDIGEDLALSALTVKSHLSRIGRKLGTGDRAQLVALAMRAGVVH